MYDWQRVRVVVDAVYNLSFVKHVTVGLLVGGSSDIHIVAYDSNLQDKHIASP